MKLSEDDGRYVQFLEGVVVQGFLQVLESEVTILTRKRDAGLVEKAAEGALKTFKDISGRDMSYSVEGSLSDDGSVFAFFLSSKDDRLNSYAVLEVSN